MEDLKILEKAFEMTEYGYKVIQQFPKSEKFSLAVDIKRCMHLIFAKQNNEVCFQCVRIKGSASLLLAENILYVDTVTSLWESIYSK